MSYTKEEKKENAAFNFKFFNFKVLRKRTFFLTNNSLLIKLWIFCFFNTFKGGDGVGTEQLTMNNE